MCFNSNFLSRMVFVEDIWHNVIEITKDYISYRNRLIDIHLIHTFQVKGKRVLINSFKQNQSIPTMCIFFESKEKAEWFYGLLKRTYYDVPEKVEENYDLWERVSILALYISIPVLIVSILCRLCM